MTKTINKFLVFDVVLIINFSLLIVCGFMVETDSLLNGLLPVFLGLMLLSSKKLKQYLYLSKIFYWISQNVVKPKCKINHLIWGLFLIFLGFIPITKSYNSQEIEFFDDLYKKSEFWLSLIFVILFNVVVGFYTERRSKVKNQVLHKKNRDKKGTSYREK